MSLASCLLRSPGVVAVCDPCLYVSVLLWSRSWIVEGIRDGIVRLPTKRIMGWRAWRTMLLSILIVSIGLSRYLLTSGGV